MYRTRLAPPIQTVALDFFAPFHFLHESCFPNPQTLFRVSYFLFPLLLLIAYTFISSAKKIDKNNNRRKQRKKRKATRAEIFHFARSFSSRSIIPANIYKTPYRNLFLLPKIFFMRRNFRLWKGKREIVEYISYIYVRRV